MSNIVYQTVAIAEYFAHHRVSWAQFYPSERAVIGELGLGPAQRVMDVGCGCAGLGLALRERFGVTQYTGVEINAPAAAMARRVNTDATVFEGDILTLTNGALAGRTFDVVFSLGCVDWNVEFASMVLVAWSHVKEGGWFVSTFRLTELPGCGDMAHSHQHINYDGRREGELAAYVVLNAGDLGEQLRRFDPAEILANGYWGPPSASAITPYERLCFSAFALRKRMAGDMTPLRYRLTLPAEISEPLEQQVR